MAGWALVLGGLAEDDVENILRWTAERFGARQAQAYAELIEATLGDLMDDPLGGLTRARDEDIGAGYRTLHLPRPGRHLTLYRIQEKQVLVVRVLHDSMELSRHLPPES